MQTDLFMWSSANSEVFLDGQLIWFPAVCCHLNINSQEGHPASVSVYKDKTEGKKMMEMVVVKIEETKIFTCLIKCLIAGCLWT